MKYKNLTPHAIHWHREKGIETIPASGIIPRCSVVEEKTLHDWLVSPKLGEVQNLPAQEAGKWLVVSRIVAEACPQRADLIFPHDLVRDDKGNIIGCRKFGTVCAGLTLEGALK